MSLSFGQSVLPVTIDIYVGARNPPAMAKVLPRATALPLYAARIRRDGLKEEIRSGTSFAL